MHFGSFGIALAIMLAGTLYPPLMADAQGRADHGLAVALMWAMSAGFVHGLGYRPRYAAWRWLFSGPAVGLALGLAVLLACTH